MGMPDGSSNPSFTAALPDGVGERVDDKVAAALLAYACEQSSAQSIENSKKPTRRSVRGTAQD